MKIGEFKATLRQQLKKDDALDDRLDGYMRRAARWIEQNYTLQYMRRRFQLDINAGDELIEFPAGTAIKTIESMKLFFADGTSLPCNKIDFADIENIPGEEGWGVYQNWNYPRQFYLDGDNGIVFNGVPAGPATARGIMVRYSDWPVGDEKTHWLINNAEGLMLRQSCLEAALDTRDTRFLNDIRNQRNEDITVLLNADTSARFTGQDIVLSA